jgi:hypothetical protein
MDIKLNIRSLPDLKMLAEYRPDLFSLDTGIHISGDRISDPGYIILQNDDEEVQIGYHNNSDLLTALGDIISEKECNRFAHPIEFRGLMLDASRNGVPKVEYLKGVLVNIAFLGINYFCLYTEDTYEVKGEPLIGYGRGRYSKDEIRELVAFSKPLGITMFPCIQTLGHLEQLLKYKQYAFLRDTERVLNALKPEVYEFLEHLLDEASDPYDTDRIHLGMDETWGIGRGNAFTEEHAIRPLKIYAEHVAKVADICRKKGLNPIMWGDFVLGKTGKPMDSYEKSLLPDNVIMDYWEYSSTDENEYREQIRDFREMGYEPLFSPGMHNWGRFFPRIDLMQESASTGMKVVHDEGVKRVLMTMWGDDGNECLFPYNYPALTCYSAYLKAPVPEANAAEKVLEKLFGSSFGLVPVPPLSLSNISRNQELIDPKMLFYDDPLCGYITRLLKDPEGAASQFANLAETLASDNAVHGELSSYYILESIFYNIVSSKISIISNAVAFYRKNDRSGLAMISSSEVPLVISKLCEFRNLYRELWMRERKPFGFEVMDIRLSGMNGRLESLQEAINNFLNRKSESIDEFEMDISPIIAQSDFSIYKKLATRSISIW